MSHRPGPNHNPHFPNAFPGHGHPGDSQDMDMVIMKDTHMEIGINILKEIRVNNLDMDNNPIRHINLNNLVMHNTPIRHIYLNNLDMLRTNINLINIVSPMKFVT